MKKILFFLCAAALLCSCADKHSSRAQQTAESFLNCYLSLDYDNINAYCDSSVMRVMNASSRNLDNIDSTLYARMKEAAAGTRYEIISVDEETEKGKAHVKYMLYPSTGKEREMSLTLTKDGYKWLVSSLR